MGDREERSGGFHLEGRYGDGEFDRYNADPEVCGRDDARLSPPYVRQRPSFLRGGDVRVGSKTYEHARTASYDLSGVEAITYRVGNQVIELERAGFSAVLDRTLNGERGNGSMQLVCEDPNFVQRGFDAESPRVQELVKRVVDNMWGQVSELMKDGEALKKFVSFDRDGVFAVEVPLDLFSGISFDGDPSNLGDEGGELLSEMLHKDTISKQGVQKKNRLQWLQYLREGIMRQLHEKINAPLDFECRLAHSSVVWNKSYGRMLASGWDFDIDSQTFEIEIFPSLARGIPYPGGIPERWRSQDGQFGWGESSTTVSSAAV